MDEIARDKRLIEQLGGPTAVAELLKYSKRDGGVQRVSNWMRRGIPPRVKLQHPELFLAGVIQAPKGVDAGQAAQVE